MTNAARDRIRPRIVGLYLILAGTYLLLMALLVGISVSLDVRHERERFVAAAHSIDSRIETLVNRHVVALEGFAALLQALESPVSGAVSSYVRFVRANQPDIESMQIVRQVPRVALDDVIAERRQAGFAEFAPKAAPSDGERTWRPIDNKVAYHLLTFMDPILPDSRDLLGLDFDSVPGLGNALQESLQIRNVVVTPPLRLTPKDASYMLTRPVTRSGEQLFASIVYSASNLVPDPMLDPENLLIEISYRGDGIHRVGQRLIRRGVDAHLDFASRLLPTLSFRRSVGGAIPLFELYIEKRLSWRIINWNMLVAILTVGVFVFPLLLAYAKAHHRNEMRRLEAGNKLFRLANFDALTGLPNRQLFLNRLEQALAVAHRQQLKQAVLYLDLNGFKSINDYYGHAVGDMVLQWAARIFSRCVREMDTVARLGGDEFVILLQNVIDRTSAESVARKIRKAFLQPPSETSTSLPIVGVSIGIAISPDDGTSAPDLLKAADQGMYQEKAAARIYAAAKTDQHLSD